MFITRADRLLTQLEYACSNALAAAGSTAVACVRQQMLSGYPEPVYDTGALFDSITCMVDGPTVIIGTPQGYAEPVHDGTFRVAGRPFLADGILGNTDALLETLASVLTEELFAPR